MYQKIKTAIIILLSVLTFYVSFLVVFTLYFNSHESINIKVNQSFRIGFHQQVLTSSARATDSINAETVTNTNNLLNLIKKFTQSGYTITQEIKAYVYTQKLPGCQPNLREFYPVGRLQIDLKGISIKDLSKKEFGRQLSPGGWFVPGCRTVSVAIIIPFRKRDDQLAIFLRHYHPIWSRQQIHYRIFVVNQVDNDPFNRGKLMNVGYKEAMKYFPYDCLVFHDVDLLLEDDRLMYNCQASPQHLSVNLNKFKYRLLYEELFGGIEMFTKEHFETVNGFSNSFWGWGAEDDNMYRRLKWKGLTLWRPPARHARYTMIKHENAEIKASWKRYDVREESYKHFATDGLNSLKYQVNRRIIHSTHTVLDVDLNKSDDILFGLKKEKVK